MHEWKAAVARSRTGGHLARLAKGKGEVVATPPSPALTPSPRFCSFSLPSPSSAPPLPPLPHLPSPLYSCIHDFTETLEKRRPDDARGRGRTKTKKADEVTPGNLDVPSTPLPSPPTHTKAAMVMNETLGLQNSYFPSPPPLFSNIFFFFFVCEATSIKLNWCLRFG